MLKDSETEDGFVLPNNRNEKPSVAFLRVSPEGPISAQDLITGITLDPTPSILVVIVDHEVKVSRLTHNITSSHTLYETCAIIFSNDTTNSKSKNYSVITRSPDSDWDLYEDKLTPTCQIKKGKDLPHSYNKLLSYCI